MAAKHWMLSVAAALLLASAMTEQASAASTPYESYNYNYWEEAVPGPAAYVPSRAITGSELGVGDFLEPGDMAVAGDGSLYVADTGNNRIVHLDEEWRVKEVIDGFENGGKRDGFNHPTGLFVDDAGILYIADTDNARIVVLASDGSLHMLIENPESDILPADFKFNPLKVTADKAKRIYVVARGVYEGIMQFDLNGRFIGYVGTNKVQRNYAEMLWRNFSTEAQKAQMVLFIPTEFSNIDIDTKGFVYATNIDPGSKEPVKRLNPSGEDVLKRFGYFDVSGDIRYRITEGPSTMIDVKVLGSGMYSVLDATQGRVFTYDDEGRLLYEFGGKGNQLGTFKTPAAIERIGEYLAVLDRGKGDIVLFEPTKFGSAVNAATALHYNGEDAKAVPLWEEVLRLNSNYDIAYIGIGKSMLMEKRNKEAIAYFKLGMDRDHYSVAFKRYRREMMKEHFGTFLSALLLLAAVWAAYRLARRRRTASYGSVEQTAKEGKWG